MNKVFTAFICALLVACSSRESAQFAPPRFVSVQSEVTGRNAVTLSCTLSSDRVETCGFLYGADGNLDHRLECGLTGLSFEAVVSGFTDETSFTWCAYASAGGAEIRSDCGTFRTSALDPVPVPDPVFREWLQQSRDSDGDGIFSYADAAKVVSISLCPSNEYGIRSLQGIEYMPDLEEIDCSGEMSADLSRALGTLEFLDVSGNPNLRRLFVPNNGALCSASGTIDLSANPKLEEIDLSLTGLSYPDISMCEALTYLRLSHLRGHLPDLSALHRLRHLCLEWPQDGGRFDLDVSGMPDLECLLVHGCLRSVPDLSQNMALETLWIGWNGLKSLDTGTFTNLEDLQCQCNLISSLDISDNGNLVSLDCSPMDDGDGNNVLETLYVASGQVVPFVTRERSSDYVPAGTQIIERYPYSLGDIVYSDGTGIVVSVSQSVNEVLLMSVTEIHDRPWEESDDWCRSYGYGWRMPTIDELKVIQPNFAFLNEKLTAAGYAPLTSENKCYWSCTPYEYEAGYYYRERLYDGSIWCYGSDEWHECYANYTRAVKTLRD